MIKQAHKILLILLFLFFGSLVQAQNLSAFIVNGTVNIDTGTIQLRYGESNKQLYPQNFKPAVAKIKNGKFEFKGVVDYPVWIDFKIGDTYTSESTAIVGGIQKITIDTALNNQLPENDNFVMKEVKMYNSAFIPFEKKILRYRLTYDSLYKIYGQKFPGDLMLKSMNDLKSTYEINDSILLAFVKSHPNSHYALFKLYHLLTFGYNNTLGETYENLSVELKNSPHGKCAYKIIDASKSVSVGATIPVFDVENINGGKLSIDYFKHNKFTLVDMWYSHCMPCIAMFDDYKLIRNANHNKGFEIIGISTDKTKFVNDWKEIIAKYELPWPQYLDLNGVEAQKYNIKKYPTTFLVNQKGEIVRTELSPVELKDFLDKNL